MKKTTTLKFVKEGKHYNVVFDSKKLGYIYREVDGFYVYISIVDGFSTAWSLRQIADKLDELNVKWDKLVEKMLKKGGTKLLAEELPGVKVKNGKVYPDYIGGKKHNS